MPRFVILRHELPSQSREQVHYDFMLEKDGKLRTWAFIEEPLAGRLIAAEALADHRIDYLDYEGPISNNRGSVTRWDSGTYELLAESLTEIVIQIRGQQLMGTVNLRISSAQSQRWIFSFSV